MKVKPENYSYLHKPCDKHSCYQFKPSDFTGTVTKIV